MRPNPWPCTIGKMRESCAVIKLRPTSTESFFFPGIAVHVIAGLLPKSGFIRGEETRQHRPTSRSSTRTAVE
jgi:hypothetical protein